MATLAAKVVVPAEQAGISGHAAVLPLVAPGGIGYGSLESFLLDIIDDFGESSVSEINGPSDTQETIQLWGDPRS